MTTCTDCTTAAQEYPHGAYRMGCIECAARMAAQSPAYYRAEVSHRIEPDYRALLQAIRHPDGIEVAHRRVRHWRKVLDELIARTPIEEGGAA